MPNDFINGAGVSVSLWVSGCPFHCKGCHNQEMQDYNYGEEVPSDIEEKILNAIKDNGFKRNFSVLGGEPLDKKNIDFVSDIINAVRGNYPNIQIYLQTGYELDQVIAKSEKNEKLNRILNQVDVIIDGQFVQSKRDITLPLRGSTNQKINYRGLDF